jgi:protein-tyrosine kinase
VDNLHLLTSGPLPPNPAELVGSQRMGQFVEHLAERFDVVIFDSPPVLAVTDAPVLSRLVDGVLIVIQAGSTRHREAHRALEELARVNAPILGVVINKMSMGRGGGYYYREYYAEPGEEKAQEKKES